MIQDKSMSNANVNVNEEYATPEQFHILKRVVNTVSDVYVFAKQGKSRHTGLWNLESLIESCENLREVGAKVQSDIDSYVVPMDLKDGLAGQIITIHNYTTWGTLFWGKVTS